MYKCQGSRLGTQVETSDTRRHAIRDADGYLSPFLSGLVRNVRDEPSLVLAAILSATHPALRWIIASWKRNSVTTQRASGAPTAMCFKMLNMNVDSTSLAWSSYKFILSRRELFSLEIIQMRSKYYRKKLSANQLFVPPIRLTFVYRANEYRRIKSSISRRDAGAK